MGLGLTYKGIHSSKFGVVKTVSRPILPRAKTNISSNNIVDGSDDYSFSNIKGRPLYDDRIFNISLQCRGVANRDAIAAWLIGQGDLIFDDEPQKVWRARHYEEIDFAPKILNNYAEYSLMFRVEPFAYSQKITKAVTLTANKTETITLEAGTFYSDDIVINISANAGNVTIIKQIATDLFGISATQRMTISNNSKMLTVDCKLKTVFTNTNDNALDNFYGEFIQLDNVDNTLKLTSTQDCTISIEYYKKYL